MVALSACVSHLLSSKDERCQNAPARNAARRIAAEGLAGETDTMLRRGLILAAGVVALSSMRLREFHIVTATHRAEVPPAAAQTLRFPALASGHGAALLLQQQDLRVVGAADLGPTASV
jgi:hypothetical protein